MKFTRIVLTGALIAWTTLLTHGQATQEKEVADVIHTLFKGMLASDSAMVRSVFADNVSMSSVFLNQKGEPGIQHESSIDNFVKRVGESKPGVLAEEIWDLTVRIDGNLAQAWCSYAFYYQGKFHHCGVDAFHFFKDDKGWKIFHLADTRTVKGCVIPKEIQDKYKP